jgi:predicted nuclease with TOPRIM domain
VSSGEAEAGRGTAPPEWARLERAVRRLAEELGEWRGRAERAERRNDQLEAAMRDLATGEGDPIALTERLQAVERENGQLRDRLVRAAAGVRRMRARLEFLEER